MQQTGRHPLRVCPATSLATLMLLAMLIPGCSEKKPAGPPESDSGSPAQTAPANP
jgi:PBP1b-binding outer membrane lipoprotein LpoB